MHEYINKEMLELQPITTLRDKDGFRFYSTNDGNTLYAEKNGKIYNVSNDTLKPIGEVPLGRSRFEFVGIIDDVDVTNLGPLHYEYKTFGRVRKQFSMAEGGELSKSQDLKFKIEKILDRVLPNFHKEVFVRKNFIGGGEFIGIIMSASNYEVNRVKGQYPQDVSLMLDVNDMDLHVQVFGGNGGNRIYLVPDKNDPNEKYLAMASVKIPFRTPKKEEKFVLQAIEKFAQNYKQALKENKDRLFYKEYVDYDKLIMAEGGQIGIGDYVIIKESYGGGDGIVEDVMNNFAIVKTKEGKKSYHVSDLIGYSSKEEAAYDLGDDTYEDLQDFVDNEDEYAEGGELESKKQNLLRYLNWFPYHAKSWSQATDEIRDIARLARITYLEIDEKEFPALDFKSLKTPSDWNTQGRFYISDMYFRMSDEAKKIFLETFEETFENKTSHENYLKDKMEDGGEIPTITKEEWSKKQKDSKLKTEDGKYYIMKYDDKIGTYLQQVKIVESKDKMASGGMTAGRWYKDNSGKEFRYIGESQGKLLFNDGEKIVEKDEEDFEDSPKEKKLFGFFEKGGLTEDEIVDKLEEQFRGKDLWEDEILDEYEVKMFDWEEFNDEETFNKWKNKNSKKNYIVPFESNDDSYIFILVPKNKMEDGGEITAANHNIKLARYGGKMAKGGETEEDEEESFKQTARDLKGLWNKMSKEVEDRKIIEKIWNKMSKEDRQLFFKNNKQKYIDFDVPPSYENIDSILSKSFSELSNGVKHFLEFNLDKNKMAEGGRVKFKDKVKAIEKVLLKKKKVPALLQKDYGKTYNKKEANESASRIVGAMVKKK